MLHRMVKSDLQNYKRFRRYSDAARVYRMRHICIPAPNSPTIHINIKMKMIGLPASEGFICLRLIVSILLSFQKRRHGRAGPGRVRSMRASFDPNRPQLNFFREIRICSGVMAPTQSPLYGVKLARAFGARS